MKFVKCGACMGTTRLLVLTENVDNPEAPPIKSSEPCTECAGTGRDYGQQEEAVKTNIRKGAFDDYR